MTHNSLTSPDQRPKFTDTFESSLIQPSGDKFMIDRHLVQGIKSNDPQKIIDATHDGGIADQKDFFNEQAQVEATCIEMKKKYNEAKCEANRRELEIEKLRKLAETLELDYEKYSTQIKQAHQKFQETKDRAEELAIALESETFAKETYVSMIEKLKHDHIIIKKRYGDRDGSFNRDKIKIKTLRSESFNKTYMSTRCKNMLQSVEKTVNYKQRERSTKINSFYDVIEKKHSNIRKKEQRQREISEVIETAMTDKLDEEVEWNKILITNRFLGKFLKKKMQKIIDSNKELEGAFHKIKHLTDIRNGSDFVNRFINREKIYGDLLASISSCDRKTEALNREKEQLLRSLEQLEYESTEIDNQAAKQNNYQLSEGEKTNIHLAEQLVMIEVQKEKLYKWGTRFLTVFDKKTNRDETMKIFPHSETKELFIKSLQTISSFLDQVAKESSQDIKEEYLQTNVSEKAPIEEVGQKNIRVRTMNAESTENDGNVEIDFDFVAEMDFFNHCRKAILKKADNNRRFRIKTRAY